MAKRKNRSKRSPKANPKGLPVRNDTSGVNPFEARQTHKRAKFQVHNRNNNNNVKKSTSALAQALTRRKQAIQQAYRSSQKTNLFVDKRIGEHDPDMTPQQQNLARLVRERSRQSKRNSKYSLQDDDDNILTHKGRAVDSLTAQDHALLLSDDDDEDEGNLDAADTALHFGGTAHNESSYYGNTGSMSQMYASRKTTLDDMIVRRKMLKAARLQSKEHQVETFTAMDESFDQLASQLNFRDKKQEQPKDPEMADWDKEVKQYLYLDRKVQATDRTKTPLEIAQEQAERLHQLETRRLARMHGDFDHDDFSDVSDLEDSDKKKSRKKVRLDNPEALSDSENEDDKDNEFTTRFTPDGLVKVNKDGVVVGKVGQEQPETSDDDDVTFSKPLAVGTRVNASYRATEQLHGNESWFTGVVSHIHNDNGKYCYDIEYDDGDFEERVQPRHVKVVEKSKDDICKEEKTKAENDVLKRKQQKAKEKARSEIPYVFAVPTTLDALHNLIGTHATTGADASLIVQRIHKANSVRLDRRNAEKMQNFYDVLVRRFVAVGDAIYESGNGGPELGRYNQLDALTKTMYAMAQDVPESAGAVWSRRLGFFQSAHAKRLRDAEFVDREDDQDVFMAWPSTGVVLALRVLGHIFPVTDLRHPIVTPALLLLGQMVAHTPVLSMYDGVIGMVCTGLLIEYTKEAKRVVPEAHGFIAGMIRVFAASHAERYERNPSPSLAAAADQDSLSNLREMAATYKPEATPKLSFEREAIQSDDMAAALLFSALDLAETSAKNLAGSISGSEKEVFAEITSSVLALEPKNKAFPLPSVLRKKVASVASTLSSVCQLEQAREPVQRRQAPSVLQKAVKSLAPRLEDPERYSMSKDKGKSATKAAADRARREYKREHKAVARELRMDAAMMEDERRRDQGKKDSTARAKRQKVYAWLEGEQAVMNQQVRQGGGVLQGGGIGAARAKAATAKLGIKKGGKF